MSIIDQAIEIAQDAQRKATIANADAMLDDPTPKNPMVEALLDVYGKVSRRPW